MELDIFSYHDLLAASNVAAFKKLESALQYKGIVGIRDVPEFEKKSRAYINAARHFSSLDDSVKQQYAPKRDVGDTEGYELGAEWFKGHDNVWRIDDKKASYYAFVPDRACNKWPREMDLRTPFLELGELIFSTGKRVLNAIDLNTTTGLKHDLLEGYGRMLHYHKESAATDGNPNWCGAHFDHGVFTGLLPAYYFRDGIEIDEPEESGLHIIPSNGGDFEKIYASDKSILLFQVGEFGQLISHDRIKATKHMVKKAIGEIERYTYALFYSASDEVVINSTSALIADARYATNKLTDGSISYRDWQKASFERYRAR